MPLASSTCSRLPAIRRAAAWRSKPCSFSMSSRRAVAASAFKVVGCSSDDGGRRRGEAGRRVRRHPGRQVYVVIYLEPVAVRRRDQQMLVGADSLGLLQQARVERDLPAGAAAENGAVEAGVIGLGPAPASGAQRERRDQDCEGSSTSARVIEPSSSDLPSMTAAAPARPTAATSDAERTPPE